MSYFILYVVIGFFWTYFLKHQIDIIKLISTKNDLKQRSKINKKEAQLKSYIKLCPIWPILLLKEGYDEIKERR
jgi:hypothetical protein